MSRSPAWISADGRVDQALRALTAHGRVRGLGRRQAELLGDEVARVSVLPCEQVDDPQRLRVGDRTQAGIDGRVADRRAHHQARVQRLARDRRYAAAIWPTPMITGACGIECHAPAHGTRKVLSRQLRHFVDSADAANRHRLRSRRVRTEAAPHRRADGGSEHEVIDLGTDSTEAVDYPQFCAAVGRAVRNNEAEMGIVLGGSGQGEQISANKVHGVRAALCNDLFTARLARVPQRRQRVEHGCQSGGCRASPKRSWRPSWPRSSRAAAMLAASNR